MKYRWKAIYFLFITGIFFLSFESCSIQSKVKLKTNISPLPVKQSSFVSQPFGFESNIKNFTQNFVPPLKIKRYVVINKHNLKQNDTIVKFYKGETELFIYKTKFNQEMFFAGDITIKALEFCNGVKVGMHRGAFFNCFTDLKYSAEDTVKIFINSPGDIYKFGFKKDILKCIIVQHYID